MPASSERTIACEWRRGQDGVRKPRMPYFLSIALFLVAAAFGAGLPGNIAEARTLDLGTAGELGGIKLSGVVTWVGQDGGLLTIQDGTAAIWANNPEKKELRPGMAVELEGILQKGQVGNLVEMTAVAVTGTVAIPDPVRLEGAMLYEPEYDCQWVRVEGIVRAVVEWPGPGSDSNMLHLSSGGIRVRVLMSAGEGAKLSGLIDAKVGFTGVSTNTVNASGQAGNVLVRTNGAEDFQVIEEPQSRDKLPVTPLDRLLGFPSISPPGHMVKTRGTVTAVRYREWVQIQSGSRGARVMILGVDENLPDIGDEVEVLGFPVPSLLSPLLEDGQFTVLEKSPGWTQPLRVGSTEEAMQNDGRLIQIRAKLLKARTEVPPARLLMDRDGVLFEAEFPFALPTGALGAQEGAVLDLLGVCEVSVGGEWQDAGFPTARGFVLRLRSVHDVDVLEKAPWWTPLRLAVALAVACGACVVAMVSASMIGGKNRRLRIVEGELLAARDSLARRVDARTDQLQSQLAARRDESSQFAVVTAERVRVARDLHDSLEQTLAGTALRLEAAREQLPDNADATRSQLVRAEELVRRSQAEVRRTVWGLRSLALEKQSFSEALRESIHLLTDDTGLETRVEVKDGITGLETGTEGELLRIAQEAVANVLKHSGATRMEIHYGTNAEGGIELLVKDDGKGFSEGVHGSRQDAAHFGLQGMRERAAEMGAGLEILSAPNKGTTIRVTLPMPVAGITFPQPL